MKVLKILLSYLFVYDKMFMRGTRSKKNWITLELKICKSEIYSWLQQSLF